LVFAGGGVGALPPMPVLVFTARCTSSHHRRCRTSQLLLLLLRLLLLPLPLLSC